MSYISFLFGFSSFIIAFVFFCKSSSYFFNPLAVLDKKYKLILILILFIAAWLRFIYYPPKHLMYVDEFWYMSAAKDFLHHGKAPWYPKSIGWPVMLSIAFAIFGIKNLVAIHLSAFLGTLTVLNIFLLSDTFSSNKLTSILASAIFAIIPGHILWSATAETNSAGLFFTTLGIFFLIKYYQLGTRSLLWTSLVIICFAAQIRVENYILFLLFILGSLIFGRPLLRLDLGFRTPWLLVISLMLPDLFKVLLDKFSSNWMIKESNGALIGANFSIQNLLSNSIVWGKHFFDNTLHPFLFTALFIFGGFYCFKQHRKYASFLSVWFALYWLVYFSSWFQTLGGNTALYAKIRFYMTFYPILTIFSATGIDILEKILIKNKHFMPQLSLLLKIAIFGILTYSFLTFYANERRNPLKELEVKMLSRIESDIDTSSIVLANLPDVLRATTDIKTYYLSDFLGNEKIRETLIASGRRILFFEDVTCAIPSFVSDCERIKNEYIAEPYICYDKTNLCLYTIKLKNPVKK